MHSTRKEDQTVGIRIFARSIEEPLRQIVENAGEEAAVILNNVKAGKGSYPIPAFVLRRPTSHAPLHHPKYDFNDRVLRYGLRCHVALVERVMAA